MKPNDDQPNPEPAIARIRRRLKRRGTNVIWPILDSDLTQQDIDQDLRDRYRDIKAMR